MALNDDDWDWEADLWNQAAYPRREPSCTSPPEQQQTQLNRDHLYGTNQFTDEVASVATPPVGPRSVRGRLLHRNNVDADTRPGKFDIVAELRTSVGPAVSNDQIEQMINGSKKRTHNNDSDLFPNLNFTFRSASPNDNTSSSSQSHSTQDFYSCNDSTDLDPSVSEFVPKLYVGRGRGHGRAKDEEMKSPKRWSPVTHNFNIEDADEFPALK